MIKTWFSSRIKTQEKISFVSKIELTSNIKQKIQENEAKKSSNVTYKLANYSKPFSPKYKRNRCCTLKATLNSFSGLRIFLKFVT